MAAPRTPDDSDDHPKRPIRLPGQQQYALDKRKAELGEARYCRIEKLFRDLKKAVQSNDEKQVNQALTILKAEHCLDLSMTENPETWEALVYHPMVNCVELAVRLNNLPIVYLLLDAYQVSPTQWPPVPQKIHEPMSSSRLYAVACNEACVLLNVDFMHSLLINQGDRLKRIDYGDKHTHLRDMGYHMCWKVAIAIGLIALESEILVERLDAAIKIIALLIHHQIDIHSSHPKAAAINNDELHMVQTKPIPTLGREAPGPVYDYSHAEIDLITLAETYLLNLRTFNDSLLVLIIDSIDSSITREPFIPKMSSPLARLVIEYLGCPLNQQILSSPLKVIRVKEGWLGKWGYVARGTLENRAQLLTKANAEAESPWKTKFFNTLQYTRSLLPSFSFLTSASVSRSKDKKDEPKALIQAETKVGPKTNLLSKL